MLTADGTHRPLEGNTIHMPISRRSILSKAAVGITLTGLVMAGAASNADATPVDSHPRALHQTEINTKIVRSYVENVFNKHNPGLAPAYLAPSVKWHGGTLGTVEGVAGVTGLLQGFIGALPDLQSVEQSVVAQGDMVVVRYVVTATQQGDLLGIPASGNALRWDAVDIYRVTHGKISEEWAGDDTTAILYQTGAYTPPWLR
jgi:predicted ester cyclase